MKKCTKCLIEKDLSEFSKKKSTKDGFRGSCKSCAKKYYKDNFDRIAEQQRKYYSENYSKKRDQQKNYYIQNSEKIKEIKREQYKDNSEVHKKRTKQQRESLKDGLHHVYYLPDHNYVGATNFLYHRMCQHRYQHGRNTDNYQILASFEDRSKALRFESLMHDSGFEGRHASNTYK